MDNSDKFLLEIYRLDKTPAYGYGKNKNDKTTEGESAGAGKRWLTPREMIQNHFGASFWSLWFEFKKERGLIKGTKR